MCDPFTTQIIRNRQKEAQVLFSQAFLRVVPKPSHAETRGKIASFLHTFCKGKGVIEGGLS